jgi:PAS domain S-box-containing protein
MIQHSAVSMKKPSPLTALAKIASLLNPAELSGPDLLASLEILGTACDARAAGIYRKWYGDSDGVSLKCLGSWFADGSMHIVHDITRERQIESQLQSSESMFRTITDYAGLGIALFQKEKALSYNERFEALLGISGREITLQDLINTVYSEDRQEISFYLDQMFQGTENKPLRLVLRAQPADNLRDYSSYAQVLDYEGKLTVCFVCDDITEQKKLARRARMNELKLYREGRLTSLGIMAAGIAHELNQPLNTIRVITDGFLFGRQKEWELDPDEF